MLAAAIKRARFLALIPYTDQHWLLIEGKNYENNIITKSS
jgi:hypothetical protein